MVIEQGDVPVSDHMFYLVDAGTVLGPPLASGNGLAAVGQGGVAVFTGISSGFVRVTVDARKGPPPVLDTEAWDEVVEVSVHAPVGRLRVSGVLNDAPEFPVLTVSGPGHYRIRVHARGRDTAVDQGVVEPVEDYLVTAWPAEPAPDASLKHTDAFGEGMRRSRRRTPTKVTPADDGRAARQSRLKAMDEQLRRQG